MAYEVGRRGLKIPRSRNGGLPANPVQIVDRLLPDNIKQGPMRMLNTQQVDIIPSKRVAPVSVNAPKFRVNNGPVNFGNRPSKNIMGVLHSLQDVVDLHNSILPSKPVPYTVFTQTVAKREDALNSAPATVRSYVKRISGSF